MAKSSPKLTFGVISILLIAGTMLVIYQLAGWNPFWMWLAAVNLITFLAYGFDKRQARSNSPRIPEVILHMLALVGGFIGGWLGRSLFRHKTRKPIFTIVLVISTIIWLGLTVFYLLG